MVHLPPGGMPGPFIAVAGSGSRVMQLLLRWTLVFSVVIWLALFIYAFGWSGWVTYDGKNLKSFSQQNIAISEKNRALEQELQSAKGEAESKQRIIEMLLGVE